MESDMNGNANSNVTKIARIFGTNTSVCSWIWVSAWNSDTTTPTTRPTTISGDDTTTMVQIASRATSRVSGPVISLVLFNPWAPRPLLRHCEERSDEAIQLSCEAKKAGLLCFARNDGLSRAPGMGTELRS